MTERDKRRRRRARARLARKRKQRRAMTLMLLCICVLLLILFAVTRKKGDNHTGGNQEAGGPQTADTQVSKDGMQTEDGKEEDISDTVTFSESQKYAGDLILINSQYPYDFEANADSISLVNIRDTQSFYYQVEKTDYQVAGRIMPYLDRMVQDCNEAVGSNLTGVGSAYRSIEYQQNVWDEMKELNGLEYAQKYVAVPGYSEHHTGLAVDMSIFYEDGSEGSFSESENALWMNDNAYHYGFVRRYAEDKIDVTGISNEAWHFRYVGVPHATYMTANNLCLEEYIDYLRDNTSAENPLAVTCDSGNYEVFFTTEMTVKEPEGEYTVSGNNVDGFIITVKKV